MNSPKTARAHSTAEPPIDLIGFPINTQTTTSDKSQSSIKYAHIVFKAEPLARIEMIRQGVSPEVLIMTVEEMGISKEKILSWLHLPRATTNRRIKSNQALPIEQSERVIGLQKLIGQIEAMVVESGNTTEFNAARWLADWLEQPLPALNNAKPALFMDTMEGIELLSSLLAQIQSGAYA